MKLGMKEHSIEFKRTIEKCSFFRNSQTWPVTTKIDYNGWLGNFKEEEKEIAAVILDYFVFFTDSMIDELVNAAVCQACYEIKKRISEWSYDKLYTDCWYSYMPGTYRASESGHIFPRKLNKHLDIPTEKIIDHHDLRTKVSSATKPMVIIMVDDFVGSGEQCVDLWNRHRVGSAGSYPPTFGEICNAKGHTVVYAPLVANLQGYNRIVQQCDSLSITPVHLLGTEYNLFNSKCACWHGDYSLFQKGIALLNRKSEELGISTDFHDEVSVRGYWGQGLALAFYDSVPDAIPAIFYWDKNNWKPLVHRKINI